MDFFNTKDYKQAMQWRKEVKKKRTAIQNYYGNNQLAVLIECVISC